MTYYIKPDGTKRTFAEISERIERERPDLVGHHIFAQLIALDLFDEFRASTTLVGLPRTFSEEPGWVQMELEFGEGHV